MASPRRRSESLPQQPRVMPRKWQARTASASGKLASRPPELPCRFPASAKHSVGDRLESDNLDKATCRFANVGPDPSAVNLAMGPGRARYPTDGSTQKT